MVWSDAGYPSDWSTIRERVLKRDDGACTNCGARGELHVHHVVPVSEGGSHSPQNLTTLCRECHEEVHGHPIPANSGGRPADRLLHSNSPRVTYRCARCKRQTNLRARGGIRCAYCGNRVLLKRRGRAIREVDVR